MTGCGGRSSKRGHLDSHSRHGMLDHPPSRMMTVVAVGAAQLLPDQPLTAIYPYLPVANSAAHHMIFII
jgi:hypothetical protein